MQGMARSPPPPPPPHPRLQLDSDFGACFFSLLKKKEKKKEKFPKWVKDLEDSRLSIHTKLGGEERTGLWVFIFWQLLVGSQLEFTGFQVQHLFGSTLFYLIKCVNLY